MDKSQLEKDLREALGRQQFLLYYQPKLDLSTGEITGTEALIRWGHPEKGLISPHEFIPVAEKTGLILPIGEWVLRVACEQNQKWHNMGFSSMIVAVNVSGCQLQEPSFVKLVELILKETGLAPAYLEIEIIENMVMDVRRVLPILNNLKRIGVRISLDDFGTGYSSLYYLNKFPIDIIKIDQSFVQNCTRDTKDETIVKAIIAMAHQLKVEVMAEGIESKEHLVFLQQNLCDLGQGYFFSKPLPPSELAEQFMNISRIIEKQGIPKSVSRQKWLEDALQTARQELQDTIRKQQGMIFKFVEKNGKLIHTMCDGELVYRIGLNPEQIVGKELTDFRSLADANRKLQYYMRAWEGEDCVTYEAESNGVWYLASLRPIRRGGHVVEVIGSCVDITEYKEVERKLRESEEKYRLIAENMQDLIGVLDAGGVVQYASPSHKTVLGFQPHQYEGRSAFKLVHPDDRADVAKKFSDMVSSKKPCNVEFRYQHANGHWVQVEARGTPVYTNKGEVEHFVVVARDISERRQSQEAMLKSEKLAVAGQLAAGLAHEIRNPLTVIQGFAQLLQKGGNKEFYVDIMLSEITRLNDVVNELLTLAKPKGAQKRTVDPKSLLEQVMIIMSSQALLHNIEINQEHDLDLPLIQCDDNQVKQVFINILQNAIEAMPNGGTITVQMMLPNPNSIQFRFTDQGSGISEERLKHLGEPFYSFKEKGTGSGLMVSHKNVQEHGGAIHIDSVVNQGTTVDVILPIHDSNGSKHQISVLDGSFK